MSYLLDANVFIEAKQRYYGLDFCPAFWDWLEAANAAGTVYSIEKVGDELAAIADELSVWAAARGPRLFLPLAPSMLTELRMVSSWAGGQGYDVGAVVTFLQVADSYLVAQALALGSTVVTQEVASPSLKRIKVPDACVALTSMACGRSVTAAADRLLFARDNAKWDASKALAIVFDRFAAVLAGPPPSAELLPVLDKIAQLSQGLTPDAHLDILAQRLLGWTGGGLRCVELALEVPTSAGALTAPLSNLLSGMNAADFINVSVSHRTALDASGVAIADMAVARWAAGQGPEYLYVAVVEDDPTQFDRVFSALARVTDVTVWSSLLPGLARRIEGLASATASTQLLAAIAERVPALPLAVIAELAPPVLIVQELVATTPVIEAVAGALTRTTRAEIPAATAAAKAFVGSGVHNSGVLAGAIARHGAAQPTVDLANLSWLLDQPEADAADVFMGLRGAIMDEPLSAVVTALERLDANRRKRWDVGKTLVERAGKEAVGARRPWLEAALPCRMPSSKNERAAYEAYEDALARAVDGDPDVDDVVTQLRDRLG